MKICFVGDIHGRIFHTIAAIIKWQINHQMDFDKIIQVGDFGAYPYPDENMRNSKFVIQDPTELDFNKYINADGLLRNELEYAKQIINCPIYFVRGNHEDQDWLESLSRNVFKPVGIDKIDLINYVPDGTIINIDGLKFAFLGGIETFAKEPRSINENVYEEFIKLKPGEIDVLVTHDAPYGRGIGFTGEIQGSKKITNLLNTMQPKYLIAGHYHHVVGPQIIGETKYVGLNILIPPLRRDESRSVQPGSIAVLDTITGEIELVFDSWLSDLNKSFDFLTFMQTLKA